MGQQNSLAYVDLWPPRDGVRSEQRVGRHELGSLPEAPETARSLRTLDLRDSACHRARGRLLEVVLEVHEFFAAVVLGASHRVVQRLVGLPGPRGSAKRTTRGRG